MNWPDGEVGRFLIGAESPRLALYRDGTVIYRIRNSLPPAYAAAQLSVTELESLLKKTCFEGLESLRDEYETTEFTDENECELFLWTATRRKSISVYGDLQLSEFLSPPEVPEMAASHEADLHYWAQHIKENRRRVPLAFLCAYDAMVAYENPKAVAWLPEQIEVVLQTCGPNAGDTSWPPHWPSPRSAEDLGHGYRRMFVDSEELPTLRVLMTTEGCLTVEGEGWAADYRIPFPAEETWMRPSEAGD